MTARTREAWVHFSDEARGVEAAGRPAGWLPVAQQVVRDLDLNINRRGVVFVASPLSRPFAWRRSLERRVGDASVAVYEALLELDE
ncbi:MAG TPA: hypothetical protein VGH35_03505 [Gaiellaceae bacterium]